MKLSFVADVHAGNHRRFGGKMIAGLNERCRMVTAALREACAETEDGALFVLGDLFDTANPSPQIVAAVQEAMGADSPKWILRGNHDMVSDQFGDDALGPLVPVAQLVRVPSVVAHLEASAHVLMVPFQIGAAHDWFPDVVADLAREIKPPKSNIPRVLCFHLGIADERTPAWLRGSHDSIDLALLDTVMVKNGIKYAFAGNWHNHRKWIIDEGPKERIIVQCGTLCPTGFDNPGWGDQYGQLVTLETDTGVVTTKEIAGPRFLKTTPEDLDAVTVVDAELRLMGERHFLKGMHVFMDVVCPADHEQQVRERLQALVEGGTLAGYDTSPDEAREIAAARTAATVAKSADTAEDAVAAYVMALPLDPPLTDAARPELLELSRRYLASV